MVANHQVENIADVAIFDDKIIYSLHGDEKKPNVDGLFQCEKWNVQYMSCMLPKLMRTCENAGGWEAFPPGFLDLSKGVVREKKEYLAHQREQ